MKSRASETDDKVIANNRKARHDYDILESQEVGLVLRGTEVKSLRASQVTFKDSYADIRNGEAWLLGCHITPYSHGTDANHDPERPRKLLLHRREINRLVGKVAERGLTLGAASPILQAWAGQAGARACPRQEATRQAPDHPGARRPAGAGPRGPRPGSRPLARVTGRANRSRLQQGGRLVSTGISEAQVAFRGALSS